MKRIGTLLLLVSRSLRQHALSTTVTVGSTALAIALVMAVFTVTREAERSFTAGDMEIDAVLGARGVERIVELPLDTDARINMQKTAGAIEDDVEAMRGLGLL